MFWHLIAAIVAALAGAGIALLLRNLSRKKLPKWIVPAFAGLGMLAYTINYEYTWFETKQARLPEGSVIVASEEGEMLWRPWTMMFPMPLGYTVLDGANVQVEETSEGRVARFVLYRFKKQHLMSTVTSGPHQLLCDEKALFRLNEAGQAKFETMTVLDADAPLYRVICAGEKL
ncbi:hypothetical protein [Stutzerimonas xanthomarina]|uniref:Uncharacterized protein n=2 Tax=Stutzerimonas xanthomarina TaxID=271420 RepID=A0A1M5KTE4_9GAMM|nr:hypothetical protein [Stutzerimonas xanthomarina]MCP9337293.1 hypothetical protein [Stutzerimonas xanthomarina]SEI08243.1 hypothetical protein SAMN05216535_4054 [Stutzerimonas xanthomarina]SHG56015.1 hypothetical protein SAMN02744645_0658 [Stutzerimonas xanthomarina DSM 18231]